MAGVEQITVEAGEAGMRLDRWFKTHYPGLGFGHLQKLLRSGQVRVDGGRAKTDELDACRPGFSHIVRAYTIGEAGEKFATLLEPEFPVERSGIRPRLVGAAMTPFVW